MSDPNHYRPPTCDVPGCQRQGSKHYRLNPHNLHQTFRILCAPCATKRRYTAVKHDRAPADYR